MGGGTWTTSAFATYAISRGRSVDAAGTVTTAYTSAQDMYTYRDISPDLDPRRFQVRECRDSDEHPNTLPVILALDVTGSMGSSAIEIAKKLNGIMSEIIKKANGVDVEFCVMAIGDVDYDRHPVQMSQFESDVRIAKALDCIYFEGGGGWNSCESYTAAWFMGIYRTVCDIWKRGGKGVIITIGDEELNPVLSVNGNLMTKDCAIPIPDMVKTEDLYKVVSEKYDVYHLHVKHGTESSGRTSEVDKSFSACLPEEHFKVTNIDGLPEAISEIVLDSIKVMDIGVDAKGSTKVDENGFIDW